MLGRNTYLMPPASSRPTTELDGVEILLHNHLQYLHHPDAFSGLYLAANAPSAADDVSVFENGEPSTAPVRKQTGKKDRHSKIYTAQGPRDRRVRLSIGIARKFFDLQEMLGFDKPSKTLDWLLTKSKAAIKELSASTKSDSSPSACEMISSDSNRRSGGKDKAASSLAKESRAKARARARERTLEKMCIKQLSGDRCDGSELNPSSFECNQLEFLQLSAGPKPTAGFRDPVFHFGQGPDAATQDLIEESVVIKRKNKNNNNPSSLLGLQQNLVLNSNYSMTPSANENWDIFGLTSQSNLHVAFDHHKFFNSNSNI